MSEDAAPFAGGGVSPIIARRAIVVGIDPGASAGSVSALSVVTREVVLCANIPPVVHDFADLMRTLHEDYLIEQAFLEQVRGYVPKESPMSMHSISKLCRHAGMIEGVLATLGIAYTEIAPNSWHRALRLPKGGSYAERKKGVYAKMKQSFPNETTQGRCDSLAIAAVGLMKRHNIQL